MIELTYHSKIRCVQRVFGVDDEQEAAVFLVKNEAEVSYELWNMFSKSRLIFENFTYDKEKDITSNFYKFEDFIIVANAHKDKLITIYKAGYDIESESDWHMLENHIKYMNRNSEKIIQLVSQKKKCDAKSRGLEIAINSLEKQVEELKEELNESLNEVESLQTTRKKLRVANEDSMRSIMFGITEKENK